MVATTRIMFHLLVALVALIGLASCYIVNTPRLRNEELPTSTPTALITSSTTQTPNDHRRSSIIYRPTNDFVSSEQEFNRILERLVEDSSNDIRNPGNYVADDADLQEILQRIRRLEGEPEVTTTEPPEAEVNRTTDDSRPTTTRTPILSTDLTTESFTETTTMTTTLITQEPARQQDTQNDIHNPENYVSSDTSLEEILRRIRELEGHPKWVSVTPEMNMATTEVITRPRTTTTEGPDECPICLEALELEERRITRCQHKFHKRCLLNWLKFGGHSCPICRSGRGLE